MVDSSGSDSNGRSMFIPRFHGHPAPMDTRPIFLTGAPRFLGKQLLARYLENTERTVCALVRGDDDEDAQRRLDETVARMLPDPAPYVDRAIAVRGDILQPGLGMAPRRRAWLAEEINEIVHGAASVSFALPL